VMVVGAALAARALREPMTGDQPPARDPVPPAAEPAPPPAV
jgi:hypothetical protein